MDKEELINGYFEGSLSEGQMEEVQQLLKTDADFATDFEFQKELKTALKKEERQEIKQLFSELNKEESSPETKVIQMRPWLVAASIALLVGLSSWFFFFNTSDLNADALYAANFAPYNNVVHPIERSNELADLKTQWYTAYEAKDYQLLLKLSEQLTAIQKDTYFDFYFGNVQMALGNHEKAIPLLEGHIKENGELKDRATWYLALAHLKLGDIKRAKAELEKLVQMNSFKTKAAEELLEALD